MPRWIRQGGLCLVVAAAVSAQVNMPPSATDSHGGFGLPDKDGRRLLIVSSQSDIDRAQSNPTQALARPDLLRTAICSGRRVPVRFERRQSGAPNNGRTTSSNFDTLPGNVFAVVTGSPDADEPCFLASQSVLSGSDVLAVSSLPSAEGCAQPARFAAIRSRPVTHCWIIARLEGAMQIALIEFERRGNEALASLVLIDGSRALFADIPATFRGTGEDLWRVDDGGVLSPDGIRVIGALKRGSWTALATAWSGSEGRLLTLWISEEGRPFTRTLNDYWYQAPTAALERFAARWRAVLASLQNPA